MPSPGGIAILSGGAIRCAWNADDAFAYLKETNTGTTPDDALRTLADGMTNAEADWPRRGGREAAALASWDELEVLL